MKNQTKSLYYSHFKNNSFSGTIPASWASMKNIQAIYLSNNNLTGPFPTVITQITSVQSL